MTTARIKSARQGDRVGAKPEEYPSSDLGEDLTTSGPRSASVVVFERDWLNLKDAASRQWPRLTPDDLIDVAGDRAVLAERLSIRYGWPSHEALNRMETWVAQSGQLALNSVAGAL